MEKANITFIGGGNMASSLIMGLLQDGYPADRLSVSEPHDLSRELLAERFTVTTYRDNKQAASNAEVLVLAVKPPDIAIVLKELQAIISQTKPLIISIAAGIRLSSIHKLVGDLPVVRCMPNTPALIGTAATALVANDAVGERERNFAESLLRAVGVTVWLDDEDHMDIVTALSGSGPAYFFYLMQALVKSATALGLPEDKANLLILQTALGAARVALQAEQDLRHLQQSVTSPGGTTEAALQVFAEEHLAETIHQAVARATAKAKELAE